MFHFFFTSFHRFHVLYQILTFLFRYIEAENLLKLWESLGFNDSEQILMVNKTTFQLFSLHVSTNKTPIYLEITLHKQTQQYNCDQNAQYDCDRNAQSK